MGPMMPVVATATAVNEALALLAIVADPARAKDALAKLATAQADLAEQARALDARKAEIDATAAEIADERARATAMREEAVQMKIAAERGGKDLEAQREAFAVERRAHDEAHRARMAEVDKADDGNKARANELAEAAAAHAKRQDELDAGAADLAKRAAAVKRREDAVADKQRRLAAALAA